MAYAVTAVNDGGEGDPELSETALMGDSYKLPVRIDFSEKMNWLQDGWTDSQNHYWWRQEMKGYVRYSDRKVLWFKLGGDEGANFNSGKLDFSHAVKPTLTYSIAPEKDTRIDVNAILPDQTVKLLATHGESTKTQYTVSLTALKGLDNVIIQFRGYSTASDVWAGLYNINIDDPTENNLAAKLHTPAKMFGAQQTEVTVDVTNYGSKPAVGYTVRLYANEKMVAEKAVDETLQANASKNVKLNFVPTVNADSLKLYAIVDYAPEQSPDDNTTQTVTVPVSQANVSPINDLTVSSNGTTNKLTWGVVPIWKAIRLLHCPEMDTIWNTNTTLGLGTTLMLIRNTRSMYPITVSNSKKKLSRSSHLTPTRYAQTKLLHHKPIHYLYLKPTAVSNS